MLTFFRPFASSRCSIHSPNVGQFFVSGVRIIPAYRPRSIQTLVSETRKRLPSRTGALAIKMFIFSFARVLLIARGMSAIWNDKAERVPVTILQISRAQVLAVKTKPKHGYWALQIGIGLRKPHNVTKAMLGHFAAAGVAPKAHVGEFRVKDESGLLPVGRISFDNFDFRHRDYS